MEGSSTLFYIDTGDKKINDDVHIKGPEVKSAWNDEDDSKVTVDLLAENRTKKLRSHTGEQNINGVDYTDRLRQQYLRLNSKPKWAELDDENPQDETMQTPFAIIRTRAEGEVGPLMPDLISIRRMRNLNFATNTKGPIVSVSFHPVHPWALVAGRDRNIQVFDVDGLGNKLLYSFKVADLAITCARFTADGSRVLIAGKGESLLIWHLQEKRLQKIPRIFGQKNKSWSSFEVSPCGRFVALQGEADSVVLLSAKNFQFIETLKMNGITKSIHFSKDGGFLVAVGKDCRIYIWDCNSTECLRIIDDNSGTECTSVSITPDGCSLIVGSNLGVLNFYEMSSLVEDPSLKPYPYRSLMNLTTEITSISCHPGSELLAYSSADRRNSLRLVHLQSGRVYSNWPKDITPMGHVRVISFDRSGKLMAIGNHKGQVLLYALRHYCSD